ncbi:MAG: hypothetical protein N3F03_04925 [Ignavibacteria bacterium]|nr:hypothetical protein [Ignavibacteria bacterium]
MGKSSPLFFFLLFVFSQLGAQQEFLNQPEVRDVFENQPIRVSIDVSSEYEVQQAFLYYRTFGKVELSVIDMQIQGNTISAVIPADYVLFPYLEYYIKVLTTKGQVLNFPFKAPETGNYFRVNVKKREQVDERIIILSPDLTEPILKDEFFLAISLLKTTNKVKKEYTRVWINDEEVTSLLIFSGDLIILPQNKYNNLNIGSNVLKIVLYDSSGKPVSISEFQFNKLSEAPRQVITRPKFKYNGTVKLESNYESMRVGNFNFNRGYASFESEYGGLTSRLNIYMTNEEKRTLQPQNRFLLSLEYDFLKLYLGDHYPVYPSLIMSGKRLRGVTGKVEFGIFNIQSSYGEITRKIEGELLQLYSRDSVVLGSNVIPIDSSKFGQPFARVNLGTFQRKLFAIRPYFGRGENFQLGFTYLHSKDEPGSIQLGARPKENVVVGSDLTIGIDNQRVLFKAQGAFSLINNDISIGNFTDAIIDSLFGENKPFGGNPTFIKRIRDVGKNFITINQFITPLNPKGLSTLAADAFLSVNYFGNLFKVSYVYKGNEYNSFGQNFLRSDIKGFQVLDRIGLFENRVFLSVSFERLNDNLQKTKIATTTFKNLETSVSFYLRKNLPNMTFSYSNFSVNNDINPITTDSIRLNYYLNDKTHQFSISSNYDLRLQTLHRLFLNIITSKKRDYTHKNLSAQFLLVNFSVQNFWTKKFSTFAGTTISESELSNREFKYYSINLGTRTSLLNEKLKTTFSINPYLGDLKRTILDFSSQYFLRNNFSLNLNVRYLFNQKPIKNESILNFFAQYEF